MSDDEMVTNYPPNKLNQYTNTAGNSFSYDNNFNLTHSAGFNGVYDAANRLVSASNGGSGDAQTTIAGFVYDGLGRCVKRTYNGVATVFVYDGWKPIAEFDAWNYLQAWNLYGPGADEILLRQKDKIGYTRFLLDRHGNVAFLLNESGAVYEKYKYDAFGHPTVTDGSGANSRSWSYYEHCFLFQGREYIREFGIYDYRHRYYHPATGRFVETDPIGLQTEGAKLSAQQTALYTTGGAPESFSSSELNLYRYCNSDPVNGSDPMGLYVTYGGKWSESDVRAFQEQFAREWADPITREGWSEAYSSPYEIRITPRHGFFGGNTGFKLQAFDSEGRKHSMFSAESQSTAPAVGSAQGSRNFDKKPQGDNTAANSQAHGAAREGGIGASEKELLRKFHDFDKSGMTFKQMKELAADIKANPGNYH